MHRKSVIIVGGFNEVIEQLEKINVSIIGIIDHKKQDHYYNYKILGSDEDAEIILNQYKDCSLIITPDSGKLREKLYNYYSKFNLPIFTLVSKDALVSDYSTIGNGSIICQKSHISSETSLGKLCKVNVGANIMHNCIVGDYTTIAPNAVILGNVRLGKRVYIGANSTILPNVTIGNDVIVGAGAVVTKSIENNKTVMGIPAK